MSSAGLAVARPHPDAVRIAGLSVAIALNLGVLLITLRPMAPTIMDAVQRTKDLTVVWITPPPKVPDPPPIEAPITPKQVTVVPRIHAAPVTVPPAPTPMLTDEGTAPAGPITPPAPEPTPVAPSGPPEATLAYKASPLTFPPIAIRQRMHGTVVLRVLVDEEGKPIQVEMEQSSGYALLDRSAREQVLAKWRFQPATVEGRTTKAWARVPVSFDLREL
ncbi:MULTISPECIES: energy transducer TonB [Dyella]|uniref:Energy transducer TonB n=2 Tax=Dyella TaxID=231454 RepID=A0A4R0YX45_9GAMM|nr:MULTISPECIES: energy transducer TonB [Dyella]TBR40500.1 energy transducer TonB [Dyella terrae]TCI11919.1 energy transducer TonB [Dyella soli]